jgi:signal recognition particle subunit SRP54
MGDVVTLVEKAMDTVNEEEAAQLAKKMEKGTFDMEDLRSQLKNLKKMGGISSLIGMLPGLKTLKKMGADKINSNVLTRQEAIISSMTKKEKKFPKLLNASRKIRIAKGSGTSVQEINKLIKQFLEMQMMMKKVGKIGENNLKKFDNMLSNKYNNKIL